MGSLRPRFRPRQLTEIEERRATLGVTIAFSEPWRADLAGVYVAETNEFRLIFRPSDEFGGCMRFLVVRRGSKSVPDVLIGSGVVDTEQAAMAAAEQMAERCARPRKSAHHKRQSMVG
jgi:hypothetical protein